MQYLWYTLAMWLLVPALYVLYICAITVMDRWKTLSKPVLVVLAPVVLIAVILDVFCQYTLISLAFWDKPREPLITQRLKRYRTHDSGWRRSFASWICDSALNPFAVGGHC